VSDATPQIQHWIVPIVKAAGLPGAEDFTVPSNADSATAWELVSLAAGLDSEAVTELVARHFRLERAQFSSVELPATRLLPAHVARHHGVVPLSCTDREVTIATSNPVAFDAERVVGSLTARSVRVAIASPDDIARALDGAYGDTPEPMPEHRLPSVEAGSEPHILVVDDDADARLLLRTILRNEGLRVSEADGGERALEMLETDGSFDLVTLDLNMDGMSGSEVLKRIRKRVSTATLPVIVATGVDDPEVEMELFDAGADDFVVKPVDPPRFMLRVRAVLRRYRHLEGWSI